MLAILAMAAFAFALLQMLVAPAVQPIAREYDTTVRVAIWVITGQLIASAVAAPIVGRFGDMFGRARVLTVVLTLFGAGALVCVLAHSIGLLIAGRVLSGIGAGVFPLAYGIINDELAPRRRAIGVGLMSSMFGIGAGVGLPLAGVIVDHADLAVLFLPGLAGFPVAVAVWWCLPRGRPGDRVPVDWTGAGLASLGLAALLLGVTNANAWGWGSARVLGLVGSGATVLWLFGVVEARIADPLVNVSVLRRRAPLITSLTTFLTGFAMFGSFTIIPQFAQTPERFGYGFGMSATGAGVLMIPTGVAMLVGGGVGGWLGGRIGFRETLRMGTVFVTGGFVLLALEHRDPWAFVIAGGLIGSGISFAFASVVNVIIGLVARSEISAATGVNTVARTVGGAFGSAMIIAVLTVDTHEGSTVPTSGAFTWAFIASALIGACAFASASAVPAPRSEMQPAAVAER